MSDSTPPTLEWVVRNTATNVRGQNKIADFATAKQTLNPDSGGNVLTQIFLLQDADLAFPCSSGFSFTGGNEQLLGTGENYFGGKTNGTLTFNVVP